MRVAELEAREREHGLRGYSRLRKAELIALLQNNPPPPPQAIAVQVQSVRFRPDRAPAPPRPRQPSPQEMDIFEQWEMSKSRPQVMSKLNDWYDWLVNHVPKTIKDGASRAFKTFKDKIMGLYNRVTGNQAQWEEPRKPEPEPFNPIELEHSFGGAYRSYRVNGRPKMDVEMFLVE